MEKFLVAGVNFRKTDISVRSRFSISVESIKAIYDQLKVKGLTNIKILSTCNRTEIYSYGVDEEEIHNIFLDYTSAEVKDIKNHLIIKRGREAINHLFKVSSGLESQIIGDYEIAGQLRLSVRMAREADMVKGVFQKILETSLQVGKSVRAQTAISDGTTSTSYAIIQHLKKRIDGKIKIALIGWGKIGIATYRNLQQYLPSADITIVNRSTDKISIGENHDKINIAPLSKINKVILGVDVIIVATAANGYLIDAGMIEQAPVKTIFDLSVPSNVAPDVYTLQNIDIFNIDELSSQINKNLERRVEEIPVALSIIENHINQLYAWQERKNSRSIYS